MFQRARAQPTSWVDTLEAIKQAELFWISTVRVDGRPHVTPLVAVWLDDALHFSTGPDEQKARNLAANPNVALTTGANGWQGGLDVVIEAKRPASPAYSSSSGSPQPGRRSGTGDGNTRSIRMVFARKAAPCSCSPCAQRKSLPSPRAASATLGTASEAPITDGTHRLSRAPTRSLPPTRGIRETHVMEQHREFSAEEAREIGERIGIDWPSSRFDVEQFRMGLGVELEHGRRDLATNVSDDDESTTGKIAGLTSTVPRLLHTAGQDGKRGRGVLGRAQRRVTDSDASRS